MENKRIPSNMLSKNGVHIENFYSIRIQKKDQTIYGLLFVHVLLLIAAVLSSIYCLITGLDLDINHRILIVTTIILCVIFWVSIIFIRYAATIIPSVLFIFTLFMVERFSLFLQGFYVMENNVIGAINDYYGMNLFRYVVSISDQQFALTFFLLVMVFFYVWFYSYIFYFGKNRALYYFLTLFMTALPCALGKVPSAFSFMVYATTMFGVHGIFNARHVDSKRGRRTGNKQLRYIGLSLGFTNVLIIAVIFLILNFTVTEKRYLKVPVLDWKRKVQDKVSTVNLDNIQSTVYDVFRTPSSVGGLDGGKLDLSKGEVILNHSDQLRITMVKPLKDIYLKGYTGVNYTGDSWSEASPSQKEKYEELLQEMESGEFILDNFSIRNLQFLLVAQSSEDASVMSSSMLIEYQRANKKYMYYPYYTWFGDLDTRGEQYEYNELTYPEGYVSPKQRYSSYKMHYFDLALSEKKIDELININNYLLDQNNAHLVLFDNIMTEMLEKFTSYSKYEKKYRRYVYDTYLAIDKRGPERLLKACEEIIKQENSVNILEAIEITRDYLHEHTDYSLSPGVTPKGEDYIDYFLFENHKGYCAHYASAATIMLRSMGIPARYVEGYHISREMIDNANVLTSDTSVIYTEEGAREESRPLIEISVDDTSAHAWVEVYIDGFGWYPVEFTKASDEDNYQNPSAQEEKQKEDTSEPEKDGEDVTDDANENKKEEDRKQKEDKVDVKPNRKDDSGDATNIHEERKENKKNVALFRFVVGMMVFLFVVAGAYGYHKYRLVRWSKYLSRNNRSNIYMKWYQTVEKIREPITKDWDINTELTRDVWNVEKSRYYGITFEDAKLQREYYLKAAFSREVLTENEFLRAYELVWQQYKAVLKEKPWYKRLWYRYSVVIFFGMEEEKIPTY